MKKIMAMFLAATMLFGMLPAAIGVAAPAWPTNRVDATGEFMPFQPVDQYYSQQNPPGFTWPPISYAASYTLKVAGNADMTEGIVTKDGESKGVVTISGLPLNVYSFSYAFQPDREYYWSVQFKTKSGTESEWSTPRRFYIDQDAYTFIPPAISDLSAKLKAHPGRAVPDAATKANIEQQLRSGYTSTLRAAYRSGTNFRFEYLQRKGGIDKEKQPGFALTDGLILKARPAVGSPEQRDRMENIQNHYWFPAEHVMLLAASTLFNEALSPVVLGDDEHPFQNKVTYKETALAMLKEMAVTKDDKGYLWDPERHFTIDPDTDTQEIRFASSIAFAYDWLYQDLTPQERAETVLLIGRNMERPFQYYKNVDPYGEKYKDYKETAAMGKKNLYNYPYVSHGWNMNRLTCAAMMIYDETALIEELKQENLKELAGKVEAVTKLAKKIVAFHYPLLSTVTDPFGYQDGASNEGPCYGLPTNDLYSIMTLSMLGVGDLTQKAWFQNQTKSLLYLWSSGWYNNWEDVWATDADQCTQRKEVQTVGTGYLNESVWQSVAKQQLQAAAKDSTFLNAYNPIGLFYNKNSNVEGKLPVMMPNGAYFPDRGWSAMYSDLSDENKIGLIYKANPHGLMSHEHADNCAFTIQAYGEPLAVDSGYYDSYGSAFHTKYTRKAYAHNELTYKNGAGRQVYGNYAASAYTTAFLNHSALGLVSSDGTDVFLNRVSNDSWDLANAIGKYHRSILYLKPGTFLVIDDIASADSTPYTYEFWLNALGSIELNGQNAATIQKGSAALDAKVQYPAAEGQIINGFAGPGGEDSVSAPSMAARDGISGKGTDKRVYFKTESLQQTKMVTTLSVRKKAEEPQQIVTENCGDYLKLTCADGTMVFVNLTDAAQITTAEGIRFSGKAFVTQPDGGYLLHEGTTAVRNGVTLIQAPQKVSVAMNGSGNELAVSYIQRKEGAPQNNAAVTVSTESGVTALSQHYDEKIRKIDPNKMSNGILWNANGNQLNLTVYPGTYTMYLNSAPNFNTTESGTITYIVDGTKKTKQFTGTHNAAGQPLYDWNYSASEIPAGEYTIQEVSGFSIKGSVGSVFRTSDETHLLTTSNAPVLKLQTRQKETVPDGEYKGYVIIDSAEDFEFIREDPHGKYYLTADIELPASYQPIEEFSGALIGSDETNLKSIRVNIDDTYDGGVGLFRALKGYTVVIKNIRITGSVKGTQKTAGGKRIAVGALAGVGGSLANSKGSSNDWGAYAEISNCVNEANVTANYAQQSNWVPFVGGFIGDLWGNSSSTGYGTSYFPMSNLVNKGTVALEPANTYGFSGGIAGTSSNNDINGGCKFVRCENYGTVSGGIAGGIAGAALYGTYQNCYNAADITGSSAANSGGITAAESLGSTISGSYNIGKISGSYTNNPISKVGTVESSYYLDETKTASTVSGAAPMTLAEMKAVTELPAAFRAALNDIVVLPAEYADYTVIRTAEEFRKIVSNGKYYLVNDIDLTTLAGGYTPIESFTGALVGADAENLTTIHFNINDAANEKVGLFRAIGAEATVKNLRLTGSVTAGHSAAKAGALAGELGITVNSTAGLISNCVNEATVTTTGTGYSYVGGFIGTTYNTTLKGTLSGLVNRGNVTAGGTSGSVGGIIGQFSGWGSSNLLSGCGNEANVSGGRGIGGIVGQLIDYALSGARIEKCYNTGSVFSSVGSPVGGIVGVCAKGAKIAECYNAGDVENIYGGGGITYWNNGTNVEITNCWQAGKLKGQRNQGAIMYSTDQADGYTITGCYYLNADGFEAALDNGTRLTGATALTLSEMKVQLPAEAPTAFVQALNSLKTVTVQASENGTLTPSGTFYEKAGTAFSVTAAAEEGYRIKNVTAGGTPLIGNEENVYSITVDNDIAIAGEFEALPAENPTIETVLQVFRPSTGNGSITFGKVTSGQSAAVDWGIVYSKANDAESIKAGKHLSAKRKALANGAFGVELRFTTIQDTYYTTPYVTYRNESGTEVTIYGETVLIQAE